MNLKHGNTGIPLYTQRVLKIVKNQQLGRSDLFVRLYENGLQCLVA